MDKRDQDLGTDPTWTEGAVLILEGSMNVCVLVNLESVVCMPSLVDFYLYQSKRRKGT